MSRWCNLDCKTHFYFHIAPNLCQSGKDQDPNLLKIQDLAVVSRLLLTNMNQYYLQQPVSQ